MSHRTRVASYMLAAAALLGATIPAASAYADVDACVPLTLDGAQVACIAVSESSTPTSDGGQDNAVTAGFQIYGQAPVSKTEVVHTPYLPTTCSWGSGTPVSSNDGAQRWFTDPVIFSQDYGVWNQRPYSPGSSCSGVAIVVLGQLPTVSPPTVGTQPTTIIDQPYHIPQACLTTTNTCVGPFDGVIQESVPVTVVTTPPVIQGTLEICLENYDFSVDNLNSSPYSPIACESVPSN